MPGSPVPDPPGADPAGADPLAWVVALDGVAGAVDRAREACAELVGHEAFRRSARRVRTEAGLRVARSSAALEGAAVPLDDVRALALGAAATDGPHRVALGAVRAESAVDSRLPPPSGRAAGGVVTDGLAQLLARVHAVAVAGWGPEPGRVRSSDQPTDLRGLGPAPDGSLVGARVQLLGEVLRSSHAPGLVLVAVAHGELLALRPFGVGNGLVARAVGRLVTVRSGLDPTGWAMPEATWLASPAEYLAGAAGFATGDPERTAAWVRAYGAAIEHGARAALALADELLPARPS